MNALNTGAVLLGLCLAIPAQALDYRFSFAGVVSETSGPVGSGIDIGSPVTGSVVYNADARPDEFFDIYHVYYNAISAFDIEIGAFEASAPPFTFATFQVNAFADLASISLGTAEPYGSFSSSTLYLLGGTNGALPKGISASSAGLSGDGVFRFEEDPSNPAFVRINWTSHAIAAVPEPETWAFLLGGLAVAAWRFTHARSSACVEQGPSNRVRRSSSTTPLAREPLLRARKLLYKAPIP